MRSRHGFSSEYSLVQVAKAHCAEFLGYCEVSSEEATSRLTPGLWLVSQQMQVMEACNDLHSWLLNSQRASCCFCRCGSMRGSALW